MKIINDIKKYKIVYLALIASICLSARPIINELLQPEQESDIKTMLKNNIVVQSIYKLANKINDYAKTKRNVKSKEKSKSDAIVDETAKLIKTELKQSTKDIVTILDETVADGKLKLGKGLKLRSQCRKKIADTTDQLEQIINQAVQKLETKNENNNLLVKSNTDAFIEQAKQEVHDIQKSMSTEMRKSLGKKPQVVFACADNAKKQIAEFEDKVVTKIEKFSDKLKSDIKTGLSA